MVPFVGVLPKTVRVADQYNLTKCILHDFEDITQKYVKNGIQLKIKKYGEQYDKIEEFTKAHKHSSKDKQYTEIMLNMINNVKKNILVFMLNYIQILYKPDYLLNIFVIT